MIPALLLWKVQQNFQSSISFFLFVLQKAVNTRLNVLFAQDLEGFLVINYPLLE